MAQPLPSGTKLAGFTIIDQIGRGGFGITYRANTLGGSVIALKEYFPADFALRSSNLAVHASPENQRIYSEGLRAFLSEANTLKSLPQQAGLVQVRAAFEKFGTAYCAMDYIEGEPLSRLVPRVVNRDGHVPEALLRSFAVPICLALETVHSCNLVHRDVKPANVMIRRDDNTPVLIDFGAARIAGQKTHSMSMFTQKYAPIELFPVSVGRRLPAMEEGPWSDIYSLSVMLYEMMVQETLPDAQTRMAQVRQGRPDPLLPLARVLERRGLLQRYSSGLMAAVDHGCALMPADRPASARQFARSMGLELGPVLKVVSRPAGARRDVSERQVLPVERGQGGGMVMVIIIVGIAMMAIAIGASNL